MLPGCHKLEKQSCAPLRAFPVPPSPSWSQQGEYYQLVGQRRTAVCSDNECSDLDALPLSPLNLLWSFHSVGIAWRAIRGIQWRSLSSYVLAQPIAFAALHGVGKSTWWGGESASGERSKGEKPRRPHSRFSNACNFAIMYIISKNSCSCTFTVD